MRWAGQVAHFREVGNAYKILVTKTEGKRPLRRHSHGWEDTRMGLKGIGWEGVDWMYLAQDRDL